MTLGETEIGEGLQLLVDPVGDLPGDAVQLRHTGVEATPQPTHLLRGTFGPHGAA